MERLIVAQFKKKSICKDKPQAKTMICILLLIAQVSKKDYSYSGYETFQIVWQRLVECHLLAKLLALSFDTTASNTGVHQGKRVYNSIYILRPKKFLHSEGE